MRRFEKAMEGENNVCNNEVKKGMYEGVIDAAIVYELETEMKSRST